MTKIIEQLREKGIITSEPLNTAVRCHKRPTEEVVQMVDEQKKRHQWCILRSRKFGLDQRRYGRLKGGIDRREH